MKNITQLLSEKISSILDVSHLGIDEDLYEYNMDSLNTHRIIEYINEDHNVYLEPWDLVENNSILLLSNLINQKKDSDRYLVAREKFKFLFKFRVYNDITKKYDFVEVIENELVSWDTQGNAQLKNKQYLRVLFWCFQVKDEYLSLLNALKHHNIKVIGLKSLSEHAEYTPENLSAIVDFYSKKIMQYGYKEICIGGNCQGGAIAYAIKSTIGCKRVKKFIWLDTFYPELCCEKEDYMIFGEYSSFRKMNIDSQTIYGATHGEYFIEKNVEQLAILINGIIST